MAVDEWLLETADSPVLRVYGWRGAWGSVGYFGSLTEARASFPGVEWVRRWTGGGTVDHRNDWTYTIVAPAGGGLAKLRGAESYRLVHAALAEILTAEGLEARLSSGDDATGSKLCFENPVSHDLVGTGGGKLAGAGQRRTKRGLLHQGSVAAACDLEKSHSRAERLAAGLADGWQIVDLVPPKDWIDKMVEERYGSVPWTTRRSGVLQAP
jgi:lipoate-protein ligase A